MANYIDRIAGLIHWQSFVLEHADEKWASIEYVPPSGSELALFRVYAVLALSTGDGTTSENVHDAWSAVHAEVMPEHWSLVPFGQLKPGVQALDDLYRDAIRAVAKDLR